MNSVNLIGRLTKDPEIRVIPGSSTSVANFTIAIDRDYKKKDGTRDTDFIPVETLGKTAEFCANYLSKGRLVAIQGSIRIDKYQDKDGVNKTFTKVNAKSVNALDSNKGNAPKKDDKGFESVDDDDIPF